MKHETNISHHDGFRVVGSRNGSYAFTEGRKVPSLIISNADARKINACARKRGIKGVGVHPTTGICPQAVLRRWQRCNENKLN